LVKTLILVNMPNFLEFKILEKLLKGVEKPGRYVNHEAGTKSKSLKYIDAHPGTILAALFFPDIYEVGMSNAGIEILYDIINKSPHYSAERVFSPWVDFEESLRKNKILLFSLENRIFLNNFDLIGFNAAHEMLYTNILNALDLSGIDHISEKRNSIFPLVCAGGTSVFNPWPLSKFMDFMVIGDGEEVLDRPLGLAGIIRTHLIDILTSQGKCLEQRRSILLSKLPCDGLLNKGCHAAAFAL